MYYCARYSPTPVLHLAGDGRIASRLVDLCVARGDGTCRNPVGDAATLAFRRRDFVRTGGWRQSAFPGSSLSARGAAVHHFFAGVTGDGHWKFPDGAAAGASYARVDEGCDISQHTAVGSSVEGDVKRGGHQ